MRDSAEFEKALIGLDQQMEDKFQADRDTAFVVYPRPLAPELEPDRIPMGHIAFMGDFDKKPLPNTETHYITPIVSSPAVRA